MIETINGIHETVNYKSNTQLRLYDNFKNENYPSHWHTPIEILMPTRNTYFAVCEKQAYQLKELDILFIAPGVIHSFSAPEDGRRIIFQAEINLLRNIKEMENIISLIAPALLITREEHGEIHQNLCDILFKIKDNYFSEDPLAEAAIYGQLLEIMVILGRHYTNHPDRFNLKSDNGKKKEYTECFLNVCNYITEHCTEPLELEAIANMAGFSKYHFSRLFKQFTNVSFYRYVNQQRISYAETLLISPDTSITEAALKCGFNSLPAFIRMFKIIKECTPTEYRAMYTGSFTSERP